MKYVTSIVFLFCFSCNINAQVNLDSLTADVMKKYSGFIIRENGDTSWAKGQSVDRAVIVSVGGFDNTKDSSTWEGRWQNYVNRESLKIGNEVIRKSDSAMIKFELLLNFSFNEDGSVADLNISCNPDNAFIRSEFRKLVLAAPKKPPVYRNSKFVRTRISQPISIKTR